MYIPSRGVIAFVYISFYVCVCVCLRVHVQCLPACFILILYVRTLYCMYRISVHFCPPEIFGLEHQYENYKYETMFVQ